jgi:hypothetical protein
MRLEQMRFNPSGMPVVKCAKCSEKIRPSYVDSMFADLDGEPFKAYYCAPCANWLDGIA